MTDRELVERYKMALELIMLLEVTSDNCYKVAKKALDVQAEKIVKTDTRTGAY